MRFVGGKYWGISLLMVVVGGCVHNRQQVDSGIETESSQSRVVRRMPKSVDIYETEETQEIEVEASKRPDKTTVRLKNGTLGYIVQLKGAKVFLTRDCYPFGFFSTDLSRVVMSEFIHEIAEEMSGWRMIEGGDAKLLELACSAFDVTEEPPYACLYGSWMKPNSDDGFVPVLQASGLVESQECSEQSGIMFVEQTTSSLSQH